MKKLIPITVLSILILTCHTLFAQKQNSNDLWKNIAASQSNKTTESWMRNVSLDEQSLQILIDVDYLKGNQSNTIFLPYPDGSMKSFDFYEASIMAPELAAKYPAIRTYKGASKDGNAIVRFDFTPKGFHAIIFDKNGTVYIDPDHHLNRENYLVYYRSDYKNNRQKAFFEEEMIAENMTEFKPARLNDIEKTATTSGSELRKYRMAMAANGEFTVFHGGTVELGLAAVVTTMNRITGIYENEVAVTFELVANNDIIIYTNPATDPYTTNEINENQTNLDNVIGTANYDIGHVVTTASGGLAGLGVVCSSSSKARGTTGTNTPIGDPFDVDYVAHEIGHQYGGNHTFNGNSGSCTGGNRNGSTAYEPGSGTTIMAYAGICGAQNTQNNSDPYFHVASLEEIVFFTTVSSGNNCAAITETGNTPPVATTTDIIYTIPINTPFVLRGNATDVDGDDLTYSWEHYDLGPAGHPNNPVGGATLFRVFNPIDSAVRYFPQISDVINQTQTIGEILPSYTRGLDFQLVVRDNNPAGGGIHTADQSLEVSNSAGPFIVTSQNEEDIIYPSGSVQTITWDVAGTFGGPVNCQTVRILISFDGGLTFAGVLQNSTENDGSTNVMIPDVLTSQARIKVEAIDNVFYNISTTDFTIIEGTGDNYELIIEPMAQSVCRTEAAVFSISAFGIQDFDDPISLSLTDLPAELSYTFSIPTINLTNKSTLTVSGGSNLLFDEVKFNILAESGVLNHLYEINLTLLEALEVAPNLISPIENASDISLFPSFSWDKLEGAQNHYFELASDADFNNIIHSVKGELLEEVFINQKLEEGTVYYWRVRGENDCNQGEYSTFSFSTLTQNCTDIEANDTPIEILSNSANTITSAIEVTEYLQIEDVNVLNLDISHTYVEELSISLLSPEGVEVLLMSSRCGSTDDILLSFDSDTHQSTIPCPATQGDTYKPSQSLTAFNGVLSKGIWQLKIVDAKENFGGTLNAWTLQVCGSLLDVVSLEGNLVSHNQIDLTWEYNNSGSELGFELESSTDDGQTFSTVANIDAGVSAYQNANLNSATPYTFRIKTLFTGDVLVYSNAVSDTTDWNPVDAPSDLAIEEILPFGQASLTEKNVHLSWSDNSDYEDGFIIERKQNEETEWTELGITTEPSYTDVSVAVETINTYRVTAFNQYKTSLPSNELTIELVLSIEDELAADIILSPNPSKGLLHISSNGKFSQKIESIVITNISGQVLLNEVIATEKQSANIELDLKYLTRGFYMVNLHTTKGIVVKKWIKN